MTSAVFAHEIGRPLDMIDKSISSLQRLIPPEKRSDAERGIARIAVGKQRLNSFMSIPLTLLSKRKRRSGRVTINSCVDQLVALLEPIVQFYRITVVMELTEDATYIHGRSEERRGGKECVSKCIFSWSPGQ